jgi:hypothetical protein
LKFNVLQSPSLEYPLRHRFCHTGISGREESIARLPGKKTPQRVPASVHKGGAAMKSLCAWLRGAVVFLAFLFFFVPGAQAGEVTLAWDANSESDLAGYKVYVGLKSLSYDQVIDVGNHTSWVVSELEEGRTYYFAVTAYNASNLESDFSNEVTTTLSAVNQSPLANAGPDQNVSEGVLVTLNGSSSVDPDGDNLVFSWSQVGGSPVTLDHPSRVETTFHAPYVGTEGETLTFQLTVKDPGGLASSDTCMVNVIWINEPPVADAGPDWNVKEGETVILDGSKSYDPDGFKLAYEWAQTGGTKVTISDPAVSQPVFTAPALDSDGETLTFALTVTDSGGLKAQDRCIVNVTRELQPPVADAGDDQAVDQALTVTLDGSGSMDPKGTSLSYAWSQKKGVPVTLDSPKSERTTFRAPEVGADMETLVFELMVTDSNSLTSSDECAVFVYGPNTGVDLTGEWLSAGRYFKGKVTYVEGVLRVQNLGDEAADSSLLYIYESTDSVWDDKDTYLGETAIPALVAGRSVDVSFKFDSYTRGSRIFLIAVIDATAEIDDINEENNIVLSAPIK